MRNEIPDHAHRVATLRVLLEVTFQKTGKRTKRRIKTIPLSTIGWNAVHEESFRDLQSTLFSQIIFAHRNERLQLCIFTDASDRSWASVVTQCEPGDLNKEVSCQIHQPLVFLSGAFSCAERGWTKFEKDGYAVAQSLTESDYMLQCEPLIRIFTDHPNLLFVFCPSILDLSLGKHKVFKVLRWVTYLFQFSYHIDHAEGEQKVMGVIMKGWLRSYCGHRAAIERVGHRLLQEEICPSPLMDDFNWLKVADLR